MTENRRTVLTPRDWELIRRLENSNDADAREAVRRWSYHAGLADGLRFALFADEETLADAATWPDPNAVLNAAPVDQP